jgi:glycosyltransferase involved in cell wall biosynthesis
MLISVIIPTFNRKVSLLRLLDSLAHQTMDPNNFEVIVVDDGSPSRPLDNVISTYSFALEYIRQENKGATIARNNGAQQSHGQILVFIDDDVSISPKTLKALAGACTKETRTIALGSLVSRSENVGSVFTQIAISADDVNSYCSQTNGRYTNFVECNTQVLAMKRSDFFDLGMLEDPTGGWPNWDDVDFGYRAHQAGYRFVRVAEAKGEHWDNSLTSLESSCKRWYRASKSAVRLFQKYPDLEKSLPMFEDKSPINWRNDSPQLILRKSTRWVASSTLGMAILKRITRTMERYLPEPIILIKAYRWIAGGYMFMGYRRGLMEYGSIPEPGN